MDASYWAPDVKGLTDRHALRIVDYLLSRICFSEFCINELLVRVLYSLVPMLVEHGSESGCNIL